MTVIAGVDVGNCNTEIIVASCGTSEIEAVWHGYVATRGRKGSTASLLGVADLIRRAVRESGLAIDLVALTPLHSVETVNLPSYSLPNLALPVRNLCRRGVQSPAGRGVAAGRHVPLNLLVQEPIVESVVVSVPAGVDFEDAALQLSDGWRRGWKIVGVLVAQDDAVLIHHRIPFDVPVVDEVDLSNLLEGDRIALEVVEPGVLLRTLADPLALANLLDLRLGPKGSDQLGLIKITRDVSDATAIAFSRICPKVTELPVANHDFVSCVEDGILRQLNIPEAALFLATAPPGAARAVCLSSFHGGDVIETADAFVADLTSIDSGVWLRRGTANLGQILLALLSPEIEVDAAEWLGREVGLPVVTVTDEATAAALGVSTTPSFLAGSVICDVGAGTVDCIREGFSTTAAGGGDVVTFGVAAALAIPTSLAELVKRMASVRVESPYVVHEEDGRRSFLPQAAPPETIGRLCIRSKGKLVSFNDVLAPEEWRSLRLAIKQSTIGANVTRCLASIPVRPTSVVMAGGGALDDELVRTVTETLRAEAVVVGRANVAGRFGPRFAVAWGLVKYASDQMNRGGYESGS